jgi:hypothetical protein
MFLKYSIIPIVLVFGLHCFLVLHYMELLSIFKSTSQASSNTSNLLVIIITLFVILVNHQSIIITLTTQ